MKKMNYLSVIGLLAVICFSSCKDEPVVVSSAVSVATKDSATISGYVTAELNLQSAGFEAVPVGTSVLVSLPYSQLNSTATGSWLKTVTVAADGKYTVKVPTNSKGVTVTISPSSFDYSQIQDYVFGGVIPNLPLNYSISSVTIDVISGQSIMKNLKYVSTPGLAIGVQKVNISGKVQADLDASIIGLENLPDGTKIIFTATGWADSASISAGKYSINVPKGLLTTWSINKVLNTKVWQANIDPAQSVYVNINKTYSITGSSVFLTNGVVSDIAPTGSSVLVEAPLTTSISGSAVAELDLSNTGLENIPNGTKIYFYTTTWGITATVSNGSFTAVVPAGKIINYYTQFVTDQKSQSGVMSSHTFEKSGSFNSGTTVSINAPDLFQTTTLTGTAKADFDLTVVGVDNIPNGTRIIFSTTNPAWTEYAIVTNGAYAINVPTNTIVNYTISFNAIQKSALGVSSTKIFQLNSTTFSSSNGNTTTLNLTATAI